MSRLCWCLKTYILASEDLRFALSSTNYERQRCGWFKAVFISPINEKDVTNDAFHSSVSSSLMYALQGAGVLKKGVNNFFFAYMQISTCIFCVYFSKRVSSTLLRQSIATEIAGMGEENLEMLSTAFMKHRPITARKSYIVNWSEREAARISMKCYQKFANSKVCRLYVVKLSTSFSWHVFFYVYS